MKLARCLLFLILTVLAFSACKNAANSSAAPSGAKRFQFKGKVIAVDRNAKTATIDHDAVDVVARVEIANQRHQFFLARVG